MGHRFNRLVRYLKSSFWFWPVVFIAAGWLLADWVVGFASRLSHTGVPLNTIRTATTLYAAPVLTTIAASAITVVTFVFSTLMVVLQLASSQLSPRILRKTIREGRAQMVLAIMVGTFVYAFHALLLIYNGTDPLVDAFLVFFGIGLMIASVIAFLYFIGFVADRVRAPAVISSIEQETEVWLKRTYNFVDVQGAAPALTATDGLIAIPVRSARSGSVTGIDTAGLTQWATAHDAVIVLEIGLGDQLTEGVTIGQVFSAKGDSDGRVLVKWLHVERERSIPGDPPWGFRMLVDIANRALSPAVNDPTTAVQVIDALEELLAVLATRSEQPGVFWDESGAVRLMLPVMSWRSYLELATHEIYLYGSDSPQVTQRLVRMIDELDDIVTTDDRRAALRELRSQIEVVGPIISLDASTGPYKA